MERSYSRYLLVVLCVSIIVTATVLVALNAYTRSHLTASPVPLSDDTTDAYRAGFAAAKEKYESYGLSTLTGQRNILIGRVQSVDAGMIIVRQENLLTDEIVSGVSNDRIVAIDRGTSLVRETQKSPEKLQQEQAAFAALPPGTDPPQAVVRVTASIQDIHAGDLVRVTASETDVTDLESVHATEIVVSR
jgi:hypothetical protein